MQLLDPSLPLENSTFAIYKAGSHLVAFSVLFSLSAEAGSNGNPLPHSPRQPILRSASQRGVDLAQGDSDADPAELEKQLSEELSAFASFQKTFSKGSLTQFARKKLDKNMPIPAQLGTVRFYMANHWMKNIMADTSPVSFYSTRPYSIFFGNLVAENPYLIDHILHASEEDLQKAKVMSYIYRC